jgi:hypothetical protein
MSWVQFPFPHCPNCHESWQQAYHRDCAEHGSIELNPDKRKVRCDGCATSWGVWETRFYCVCGHAFGADEVEGALNEVIRAAELLARVLEDHRRDVEAIRQEGKNSLRAWLDRIAEGVGGSLGYMLGRVIGSLFG